MLSFQVGVWTRITPRNGWMAYVLSRQELRVYVSGAWLPASGLGSRVAKLGINADADTTNRLSLAAPSTLLNHDGAGHQLKLNKASATDTASLLFQTAFGGRAEMGLAGSDAFSLKVSADGSSWREAIAVDKATGLVSFTQGAVITPVGQNLAINGDFQVNQRGFAGGALAAGVYGYDRWKGGTAGATLTRSGLVVTLSAGGITQIVEPAVFGEVSLAGRSVSISVVGLTGGALSVKFRVRFGDDRCGGIQRHADDGRRRYGAARPDAGRVQWKPGLLAGEARARDVRHRLAGAPGPDRAHALPALLRKHRCRQARCRRATRRAPAAMAVFASANSSTGSVTLLRYLVPKRATPTLTIRDGAAASGKISVYDTAWRNGFAYSNILGTSDKGFSLQQVNAGVLYVSFDYAADAEL